MGRYEEALERAKQGMPIDEVFPELKDSEDERIRKWIIDELKDSLHGIEVMYSGDYDNRDEQDKERQAYLNKALAYLEKQKDASKAIEAVERIDKYIDEHVVNAHDMKDSNPDKKYYRGWDDALAEMSRILQDVYSNEMLEKEQKPIECDKETDIQKAFREGQSAGRQEVFDNPGAYGLEEIDNVFGFRIGDKVRLVDGDGRPHIIKRFEKIEGLHGPDFYRVLFEDNAASDHIIPGDEYPNGYFTHIEKIDEQKEQKPVEYLNKDKVYAIMKKLHDLAFSQWIPINSDEYKKIDEITSDVRSLLDYPIEQKLVGKIEPKFKVGDKVYAIRNRFECTIEEIDETTYYGDTTNFDIKDQDKWKLISELEQKPAEKQDYSGLNDLEHAILHGFLCAGVENVLVSIIKETAQECIGFLKPTEWSEDWREEDIQTRFAFYTYKDDPSVLYLSNVFVEETSRNHGFGTRILKVAEKAAEAIGAITIRLKVKQNSPENAWYRKNGYGYMTFEDGYDWLEKNLGYLKPKKEVEWSEEDERILRGIEQCVYDSVSNIGTVSKVRYIDWLQSIRPPFKDREMKLKILKYLSTRCSVLEFEEVETYLNNLRSS